MLVNLTSEKIDDFSKKIQDDIKAKYGTVLEFDLPVWVSDEELEDIAYDFFIRITAALDACANEPKENAVCMRVETHLEKQLLKMLVASDVSVKLVCW